MARLGFCELVIACDNYCRDQFKHRRVGRGWLCPVCIEAAEAGR
jgi:hypothetical protein